MSVLSSSVPGFRRFLSPQCAVPRLRILYFTALVLCGTLLVLLHVSIAGERRDSAALAAATRDYLLAPRVIVVRMPPVMRATKAKTNIRRAPARTAARKEK